MNKQLCQCVNTKIGAINIKAGKRPVFILELASDDGQLFIKFFNVNRTAKGNYTTDRNGDFAKLYRLTAGENPSARFSRCDKLLSHFVGHRFFISYELAGDRHGNDYLRATSIKPERSVVGDEWTLTGHLIINARKKPVKSSAKNRQRLGNFEAKNGQFLGNCNSTQGQTTQGLEPVFDPIPHPLSKIGASHIPNINNTYIREIGQNITDSPPAIDLANLAIDQQFVF